MLTAVELLCCARGLVSIARQIMCKLCLTTLLTRGECVQVSGLMEAAKAPADQQRDAASQQLQGMQFKNQSLTEELTGCKEERDRLHEQLMGSSTINRRLADENGRLLAQLKALQGNAGH